MSSIVGKWAQVEGQPYPGLWFKFEEDGTFSAAYEAMGITSGGRYKLDGDQIDMNQTAHTLGVVGLFEGVFEIEGETLKLALNQPGQPRELDISKARIYKSIG